MTKLKRFLATPFGLAVVALVALAGWSLWSAGVVDDDLQRAARSGSVYAVDSVHLDQAAAERIIGNRRLFVAFLEPGTDLGDRCDDLDGPADGTLVLLLSRDGAEDFSSYGCWRLPGGDDENFGKAFVAETTVASGTDQFVQRPLEALKVIAVNYDQLVKARVVPDGARSITPSLPRYLVAIAAVVAILAGTAFAYLGARRAGRLAARHREDRDTAEDARSSLNAKAAVLAQQIIELDRGYSRGARRHAFRTKYRALASDYADLVADVTKADENDVIDPTLDERVQSLSDRARELVRR